MNQSQVNELRLALLQRDSYLGNNSNVAPGRGSWVEDDNMHRWCVASATTVESTSPAFVPVNLELVGKVYTYGNYTGILGGRRSDNKSFKLRSTRRTLCLTAPKDGFSADYAVAVSKLGHMVNLRTKGGPAEHLWQKGTADSVQPILRIGGPVFANLQPGQAKDSRILQLAPAADKDDRQWKEVADECMLTRLNVRDHTGGLIPEVDIQSALSGATVLATVNLKSWRWDKAKPTGFTADIVSIVILFRARPQTFVAAPFPLLPHLGPGKPAVSAWATPEVSTSTIAAVSTQEKKADGDTSTELDWVLPSTGSLNVASGEKTTAKGKYVEGGGSKRVRLDGAPFYPAGDEYVKRDGHWVVAGQQPLSYAPVKAGEVSFAQSGAFCSAEEPGQPVGHTLLTERSPADILEDNVPGRDLVLVAGVTTTDSAEAVGGGTCNLNDVCPRQSASTADAKALVDLSTDTTATDLPTATTEFTFGAETASVGGDPGVTSLNANGKRPGAAAKSPPAKVSKRK
ncbi:hypothetical protein F5877DRAFT_77777 [Lentinula edodes]|nr:hypothetical protein F5877DRAFT_77777 [Lentinula edodes]